MELKALQELYKEYENFRVDTKSYIVNLSGTLLTTEFLMMDKLIECWGWKLIDCYADKRINRDLTPNEIAAVLYSQDKIKSGVSEAEHLICQIFMSLNYALQYLQYTVVEDDQSEMDSSHAALLRILEAKDFCLKATGLGVDVDVPFNLMSKAVANEIKKKAEINKKKGKGKRGYKDREHFQAAYRKCRDLSRSRPATIKEMVAGSSPYAAALSTLEGWAIQADKQDGIIRKPGRK